MGVAGASMSKTIPVKLGAILTLGFLTFLFTGTFFLFPLSNTLSFLGINSSNPKSSLGINISGCLNAC